MRLVSGYVKYNILADDALPWFAAALMRGFDEGRDNTVKALKGEQL